MERKKGTDQIRTFFFAMTRRRSTDRTLRRVPGGSGFTRRATQRIRTCGSPRTNRTRCKASSLIRKVDRADENQGANNSVAWPKSITRSLRLSYCPPVVNTTYFAVGRFSLRELVRPPTQCAEYKFNRGRDRPRSWAWARGQGTENRLGARNLKRRPRPRRASPRRLARFARGSRPRPARRVARSGLPAYANPSGVRTWAHAQAPKNPPRRAG